MDLATAGVPFERLRSWRELVETGELARTLTRLCVIATDRLALGYRLTRDSLEIAIDGTPHAIELPDGERDVLSAMARVLLAINELLPGDEQLVLISVRRVGYRIVLVDPRALPEDVTERECTRPPRGELVAQPIAVLPAIEASRLDEDGSVLGLVAAYVERLARFAGMEHVSCEPRWKQDPGTLTFTLAWRPPERGGVQVTLRVPLIAGQIDPQPILDALNRYGGEELQRHLYRVARGPDRVDVALLDRATAAEFRRRGDLVEHPARTELRVLADSGFELSSLHDQRCRRYHLHELATRLALLAASVVELSATVGGDEHGLSVTWRIAGAIRELRYPGDDVPLVRVLADLNGLLAAAGCAHRCVAIVGEPFFYGCRIALLDRLWLAALARTRCMLPGCVDAAELAALDVVLGVYPPAELATTPLRLPRLDELVARESVLDHDFKCSARPSDLGELIGELGRFARVALDVGACTHVADGYTFAVTYRNMPATIELADEKYVDVSPILAYLNELLAIRAPRHQLYYFRSGTWGSGIVRATDEEAAKLRLAGYIA
jgi:hypothetical protein